MTEEERTGVRHLINQTIERLQRASVGANHMGSRYARLVQLLWRKSPKRAQPTHSQTHTSHLTSAPHASGQDLTQGQNRGPYDQVSYPVPNQHFTSNGNNMPTNPAGFSWLDLGATWNFATQNGNNAGSSGSQGDFGDEGSLGGGGFGDEGSLGGGFGEAMGSGFDLGVLTDYSLLERDNPNLIF